MVRARIGRASALVGAMLLFAACHRSSSRAAVDGARAPLPGPLADLALTFSTHDMRGASRYELKPDRTLDYHGSATAHVKLSAHELEPLDALLRSVELREAAKPPRAEIGDVGGYDLHVTSTTLNLDARGYLLDGPEYTTPVVIRALASELDKLRALSSAHRASSFAVTFRRIEQGGAAGKVEIFDVRSDGTAAVRDQGGTVLRAGKVSAEDLEPLGRILASQELAALGTSYVDPTPAPETLEVDYDIDVSKTTTLKGTFHDKTPPIVVALTEETMSLIPRPK